MSSTDTTIELRILGALDSSLESSIAAARAQIQSLGQQTEFSARDIKAAFGGEIKGAEDLTARINALSGVKAEAAVAANVLSDAETTAAQAATAMGGASSNTAGVVTTLVGEFAGAGLASLAMAGGVAAATAAIGYLVYEAIESEIAIKHLADSFAFTGRQADFSESYIRHEIAALSEIPGVSRSAAMGYLSLVSSMAEVDTVLENQVGQLLPAFIKKFGDDAPKAAAQFVASLEDLSVNGLKRMDRELLGLQPEQYAHIQSLIRTGQEARATSEILAQLSKQTGVYIKSTGDMIYDAEQRIKQLKEIIAHPVPGDFGVEIIREALRDLAEKEKEWNRLTATQRRNLNETEAKKAIDLADQINARMTERQRLAKEIADLERGKASNKGNAEATEHIDQALSKSRASLEKIDNEEAFRSFERAEQQKLAAYKSGSAERIAIDQKVADKAAQLLGRESAEYNRWATAAVQDKRSAGEQMVRDSEKSGQDILTKIRSAASDIKSSENLSATQKLDALRALWRTEIQGHKFTADQIAVIQKESKSDINRAEKAALAEHLDDVEEASRKEIDLAMTTARLVVDAIEQKARLGRSTVQQETLDLMAAENVRYQTVKASLEKQREAAEKIPAQLKRINKEIEDNEAAHQLAKGRIQSTALDKTVREYRRAFQPITDGFETALRGMMSGQQTFLGALRQGAAQMVEDFIMANVRKLENWIITEIAMTSAAEAGDAARTASGIVAGQEGMAVSAAMGSSKIMNDAYEAAAGAYKAVVGIPYVGPFLAPVAAGVAFAAVAAFDMLTSAEGGAWEVNGGFFKLHEKESVMPAYIASPMRTFFENGNANPGRGGDTHIHLNNNATSLSPKSAQRMLNDRTLMRKQARNLARFMAGNPNARPAY